MKYLFLLFVLSALVWLTACERVLEGSEKDTVLALTQSSADNLFAGLTANDYAAFSSDFDPDMQRELPVTAFPAWKQNLDDKLGRYLDRRIDRVALSDEFYVVDYRVKFAKADPVKFTVVFHSSEPKSIALVGYESEQASWSAFEKKTPQSTVCAPRPTFTPDLRPTITPLRTPPTAAPPPTAGPPPPFETPAPYPTLSTPLSTREQVLEKLLEYDFGNRWDELWCLESLRLNPERFVFQHFPTYNESGLGRLTYGGEYEPVWVVTIRGPVLPLMIGWRSGEKAAYLTYYLGEHSGVIYGMSAGPYWPPPTDPPTRTRDPAFKTRTPRPKTPLATNTP